MELIVTKNFTLTITNNTTQKTQKISKDDYSFNQMKSTMELFLQKNGELNKNYSFEVDYNTAIDEVIVKGYKTITKTVTIDLEHSMEAIDYSDEFEKSIEESYFEEFRFDNSEVELEIECSEIAEVEVNNSIEVEKKTKELDEEDFYNVEVEVVYHKVDPIQVKSVEEFKEVFERVRRINLISDWNKLQDEE